MGAAQQGADAGQQLIQVIRLDDVVVGPRIQAGYALGHGVARGGDQHRQARTARAQGAQHVQAALARQTQVQQQQVVGGGGQRRIGLGAVAHPVGGVAFGAQRVVHHLADHGVVFGQQDSHAGIVTQSRRPRKLLI